MTAEKGKGQVLPTPILIGSFYTCQLAIISTSA